MVTSSNVCFRFQILENDGADVVIDDRIKNELRKLTEGLETTLTLPNVQTLAYSLYADGHTEEREEDEIRVSLGQAPLGETLRCLLMPWPSDWR